MRLSRDEAREVAIAAVLLALGLRVVSGVVQAIEEFGHPGWDRRSVLGRLVSPIGTTAGMMAIALALVIVLSPRGSISGSLSTVTRGLVAVIAVLGGLSAINTITLTFGDFLDRLWFALINGVPGALLGGAAWWILHNFDPER